MNLHASPTLEKKRKRETGKKKKKRKELPPPRFELGTSRLPIPSLYCFLLFFFPSAVRLWSLDGVDCKISRCCCVYCCVSQSLQDMEWIVSCLDDLAVSIALSRSRYQTWTRRKIESHLDLGPRSFCVSISIFLYVDLDLSVCRSCSLDLTLAQKSTMFR